MAAEPRRRTMYPEAMNPHAVVTLAAILAACAVASSACSQAPPSSSPQGRSFESANPGYTASPAGAGGSGGSAGSGGCIPGAPPDPPASRFVRATQVSGENLLRLGTAELDVTPLSTPDAPVGLGVIALPSVLGEQCGSAFQSARVFANDGFAYVVYEGSDPGFEHSTPLGMAVAVIDVSDPAQPRLVSNTRLGFASHWAFGTLGYDAAVSAGDQIVQLGSTLVLQSVDYGGAPSQGDTTYGHLWIVDLSGPETPRSTRFDLPAADGLTALHGDGTSVLATHFEPVEGDESRVRFYLDRVDVSDPSNPRLTGSSNVPGVLMAWDASSGRAITVDYRRDVREHASFLDCPGVDGRINTFTPDAEQGEWINIQEWFLHTPGTCSTIQRSLRQVRVLADSVQLEGDWDVPRDVMITGAAAGDNRVFVGTERYSGERASCSGCAPAAWVTPLLVLSGMNSGALSVSFLELSMPVAPRTVRDLVASGHRALGSSSLDGDYWAIDAESAQTPLIVRAEHRAVPVESLELENDVGFVSLGRDGVEVVDWSP